jgi:hypothetical protein
VTCRIKPQWRRVQIREASTFKKVRRRCFHGKPEFQERAAISWPTLGLPCNRLLSHENVTVRSLYNMSPFGYYFDI